MNIKPLTLKKKVWHSKARFYLPKGTYVRNLMIFPTLALMDVSCFEASIDKGKTWFDVETCGKVITSENHIDHILKGLNKK